MRPENKEIQWEIYLREAYLDAKKVIDQLYISKEHKLYAPMRFPNSKNPVAENSQKPGFFIYPHEATAIRVLLGEASKIALMTDKEKVDSHFDDEFLDGIAEFGNRIGDAAGVRQGRILNTAFAKSLSGTFEKDSTRTIGKTTTNAIIEFIEKTTILDMNQSKRVEKRIEGAKMAQSIYIKILEMYTRV